MEKLTYKMERKRGDRWERGYYSKHNKQHLINALAAYEDTGLMPEQIQEIDRLYTEKCQEVAKLRQRDMPERPKILEEIQKSEDEYINEDHHPMFKLGAASIAAEIKDIIKKHLCCKSDADVSSGAAQSKIEGEKEDVKEVE